MGEVHRHKRKVAQEGTGVPEDNSNGVTAAMRLGYHPCCFVEEEELGKAHYPYSTLIDRQGSTDFHSGHC
jgi:hypothetical protein